MNKDYFNRLSALFTVKDHIQESHTLTVQEQLIMFLTMVAHGNINKRSAYEWNHLGETICNHFDAICSHLAGLSKRFIVPLDLNTVSPVIANN